MRQIKAEKVTGAVSRLSQEASVSLGEDVKQAVSRAMENEDSQLGRKVLEQILENARLAETENLPLCQDTGSAVVFLEIGQDLHVVGGDLYGAVQEGVRRGYREGSLRKSTVEDPVFERRNTGDNTPAVIYADVVPGEQLKITLMPKGAGSENMSRLFMLTPDSGREGVEEVVVQAVSEAGGNPCPPLIVGVGIGGTAEKAMLLAKKSLLRPVGKANSDAKIAVLEEEILAKINTLGIGPLGYGGRTTALAVHIETFPGHIASLPVAVNLSCHSARHKSAVI